MEKHGRGFLHLFAAPALWPPPTLLQPPLFKLLPGGEKRERRGRRRRRKKQERKKKKTVARSYREGVENSEWRCVREGRGKDG